MSGGMGRCHVPYMNAKLRKEMYFRNKLKNNFFKNRTTHNWNLFKSQRNKVTSIRRHSLKQYLNDRCMSDGNGNDFWKTAKPFMTDKGISSSKFSTVLIENDVIISDPKDVCQVFNTYFSSIAESIGKPDNIKDNESIEYVIECHSNHPSVVLISQSFNVIDTFKFTTVYEVQVEKQIKSVNPKKKQPDMIKYPLELSNYVIKNTYIHTWRGGGGGEGRGGEGRRSSSYM